METHKIAGLRSMIAGAVLMLLSAVLFVSAVSSSVKVVNALTAFFLLYVVFAVGVFLLVHGIFVHFPHSQVRVHHAISYSVLAIIVVVVAYCLYQGILTYY